MVIIKELIFWVLMPHHQLSLVLPNKYQLYVILNLKKMIENNRSSKKFSISNHHIHACH